MKLREIPWLLGFRPAPQTYDFEVICFDLPREGRVQYAHWLHPRESPKKVTQASVDQLRAFLKQGDVAIDIGAHTGDTTIPMALAVGTAGTVFAVEPNPYVFPILKKNSELNPQKTKIVPLAFAATAEDGQFEFEYGDAGFCNGGLHENVSRWKHGLAFKLKVTGKNLENYLKDQYPNDLARIRYIKVDAEGYDFSVLQSLSGIISRYHPFIRAEVFKWTDRSQRARLLEFFHRNGYTVWRVENDENYCAEVIAPQDGMQWPHYDVLAVPRGCPEPKISAREKGTISRR